MLTSDTCTLQLRSQISRRAPARFVPGPGAADRLDGPEAQRVPVLREGPAHEGLQEVRRGLVLPDLRAREM